MLHHTHTQRAFTLVEILVTIGILIVLAALLLPAVIGVRTSAATTQTLEIVEAISRSIRIYNQTEKDALQPDDTCFIDWDPAIDPQDVSTIGSFSTWPVLNRLDLKMATVFDRGRMLDENSHKRLHDYWDQPIRFVVASGSDDNGHQPQGSRDSWNWNPTTGQPLVADFSYVYSYGPDNIDGTNTDAWIINEDIER